MRKTKNILAVIILVIIINITFSACSFHSIKGHILQTFDFMEYKVEEYKYLKQFKNIKTIEEFVKKEFYLENGEPNISKWEDSYKTPGWIDGVVYDKNITGFTIEYLKSPGVYLHDEYVPKDEDYAFLVEFEPNGHIVGYLKKYQKTPQWKFFFHSSAYKILEIEKDNLYMYNWNLYSVEYDKMMFLDYQAYYNRVRAVPPTGMPSRLYLDYESKELLSLAD